MIKLKLTDRKGQSKELEAQIWLAHKNSPLWVGVHLRDGRSFQISKFASVLLYRGHNLNVKVGEEDFVMQRIP